MHSLSRPVPCFATPKSKRLIYYQQVVNCQGAHNPMRLESEVRRSEVLERHYVHGKWVIVKVYIRGELREIVVRSREGDSS
jgi:hypothetical protein